MNKSFPKKKELTIHGHENCPECNKVGWNDCHDAMTDYIRANNPSVIDIMACINRTGLIIRDADRLIIANAIVKLYKETTTL